MGVLDIILIKELIPSPETVNTDFSTDSFDISNRQDEFSVQITYDNGVGVDMVFVLEASNDNLNFSPVSTQAITDASGSHIFGVFSSGVAYMRVSVTVNAGSIDLQSILYKAKRAH